MSRGAGTRPRTILWPWDPSAGGRCEGEGMEAGCESQECVSRFEVSLHRSPMSNSPLRLDELLAESLWVRRIARGLLRDAHDAEDVAQEVLAAAYGQQPSVSGENLRAWLRTVTKRKAARKKQVERNRAYAERRAVTEGHDERSVTERVALHSLLVSAIEALPPLLGETVMLRYFDDLTPRQIAKQLGVTGEVARQRVSRGLKLLRERLDREADIDSPERGREAWSAALVETLALTKPAAVSWFSPLLLMSFKAKAILGCAAVAAALLLIWPTVGVGTTLHSQPGESSESQLAPVSSPKVAVLSPAPQEGRAPVRANTGSGVTRVLRIRTPNSQAPTNAAAAWVDEAGAAHSLAVDTSGDADLAGVPRGERVWVRADAHLIGFIEINHEHSVFTHVLDPGLRVPGILIEDGGIPRARTTIRVSWSDPLEHELEADGIPEDLGYALGISHQFGDLHPDAQGRFEVAGIPAGAELRFRLASSHIFELGASENPNRCTRSALEGETVELRTLRCLSISARLLRADNGEPAKLCPGYFHFRNEAGDRRGALDDVSDRDGYYSSGHVPEGWRSLNEVEREEAKRRWVYVEWIFLPNDPSLGRSKGRRRLDADEFFVDLGDIYLESKPVLDAIVYGFDRAPLPGAVIRCPTGGVLRSDSKGRVKLPESVRGEHVTVMALDHAVRHFSSTELTPAEDGLLSLYLEAGIELHLSVAEEDNLTDAEALRLLDDYRVTIAWDETPFLRSPIAHYPFDSELHNALWDLNEGFGGYSSKGGPASSMSHLPESGVVRLFSLRPDAPLTVRLRDLDGSVLYSADIRTPTQPGRHELKLPTADQPRSLDSFRIRGQLVDEGLVPVAAASLTYDLEGIYGDLQTDAEGRFESGPLPTDEWPSDSPFRIRVKAEGHVKLCHQWQKLNAKSLNQLQLIMPRSRRIEIRAVAPSGDLLPIESVTLEGQEAIEFEGQPNDAGVWISDVAPLLDLRLVVQQDGRTYPLDLSVNEADGRITVPAEHR